MAILSVEDGFVGFFIWQIQDLQYAFDTDTYMKAGVSLEPVPVEGQAYNSFSSEWHESILSTVDAGESTTDDKNVTAAAKCAPRGAHMQALCDPGTYTVYAWAVLKDGRVYSADSATVTVLAPPSDDSIVRICTGGTTWKTATPYICTGGTTWKKARAYICTGGSTWK